MNKDEIKRIALASSYDESIIEDYFNNVPLEQNVHDDILRIINLLGYNNHKPTKLIGIELSHGETINRNIYYSTFLKCLINRLFSIGYDVTFKPQFTPGSNLVKEQPDCDAILCFNTSKYELDYFRFQYLIPLILVDALPDHESNILYSIIDDYSELFSLAKKMLDCSNPFLVCERPKNEYVKKLIEQCFNPGIIHYYQNKNSLIAFAKQTADRKGIIIGDMLYDIISNHVNPDNICLVSYDEFENVDYGNKIIHFDFSHKVDLIIKALEYSIKGDAKTLEEHVMISKFKNE